MSGSNPVVPVKRFDLRKQLVEFAGTTAFFCQDLSYNILLRNIDVR